MFFCHYFCAFAGLLWANYVCTLFNGGAAMYVSFPTSFLQALNGQS